MYIGSRWFFPELVTSYLLRTNTCFPVTHVIMSGSRKGKPRHCSVFTFSFICIPVIKISVIISFTYFMLVFQELMPSALRTFGHYFTTSMTDEFMSRMVQLLTGFPIQFYGTKCGHSCRCFGSAPLSCNHCEITVRESSQSLHLHDRARRGAAPSDCGFTATAKVRIYHLRHKHKHETCCVGDNIFTSMEVL